MTNEIRHQGASSVSIAVGIIVLVCLLLALPYYLTKKSEEKSVNLDAHFIADKSASMSIEDAVRSSPEKWQKVTNFNFGFTENAHWLKVSVPTNPKRDKRLLVINYALVDHLDIWFVNETEERAEIISRLYGGDRKPFEDRGVKHEYFIYDIPIQVDGLNIYVKASSKGPLKVPLEMWTAKDFIEFSSLMKLFLGLFLGYMAAMSLSNIILFAFTRNSIFLLYTGYVSSIALVVASLQGIGFRYLWSSNIWFQEAAVIIFACSTMIFIISLTMRLLSVKDNAPKLHLALQYVRFAFSGLLILSFAIPYEIGIKSTLVLLIISTPIILTVGVFLALRGDRVARYFCAAWAILLMSGLSIALENFGIYVPPIESAYLLMVGALTESLLLAYALAINFNEQLQKAKSAQTLALKNEQEAITALDELIALQEQNQADLEYSIEERTLELEVALRELAEKNKELEDLSAMDPLTGLMNRRYFDKRLLAESRRSRREQTPLSLAIIDIDHFKKVNDTYGHLCGDFCLKEFASILKATIKRPSDVICRYGGEEFVLVLPNTDMAGLALLLENVRRATENHLIRFEEHEFNMTVSIGGCTRVTLTEEENILMLGFVDKRLYEAKSKGRNCVVIDTY